MERRIFKYILEIQNTQVLSVYKDYKILSAQEQEGRLVIWICVDLKNDPVETAELFQDWDFIDTVQMSNGLVWHLFDNKAPF